MVIINAYIIFVIKLEHICTNYIPWSHQDVMVYGFFPWAAFAGTQDMLQFFT